MTEKRILVVMLLALAAYAIYCDHPLLAFFIVWAAVEVFDE